jgi:hypothetical protein
MFESLPKDSRSPTLLTWNSTMNLICPLLSAVVAGHIAGHSSYGREVYFPDEASIAEHPDPHDWLKRCVLLQGAIRRKIRVDKTYPVNVWPELST